jgi:hypothetical protein
MSHRPIDGSAITITSFQQPHPIGPHVSLYSTIDSEYNDLVGN